jgi:hypothetical protein
MGSHTGETEFVPVREYTRFDMLSGMLKKFRLIASLVLLWMLSEVGSAGVLCQDGFGAFQAELPGGVQVTVGAARSGSFAARACQATLRSGGNKQVIVDQASQVDLDMFGVDLNDEGPVAAFQIKPSEDECCMTYQIYSLKLSKTPRLLRTLTGGFFQGADTDLDGKVEIWATDAAVLDSLDGLTAGEMEFPPTYVLRLAHGRLLDVNSEFRSYFDDVIAKIRTQIDPALLHDFRLSDGLLEPKSDSEAARMNKLRPVKIQVLELVCAYLYSGREEEAWKNLGRMWPEGDMARIQLAIADAHARGIMTQLDGVSKVGESFPPIKKKAPIYEFTRDDFTRDDTERGPARVILMWAPDSVSFPHLTDGEASVDLIIDSAGKVQSATPHNLSEANQALLSTAKEWKFIPAFRDGHSVASYLHQIVSLKR